MTDSHRLIVWLVGSLTSWLYWLVDILEIHANIRKENNFNAVHDMNQITEIADEND